jgi:4-amino-4-deoxy-L-arabinose transferase
MSRSREHSVDKVLPAPLRVERSLLWIMALGILLGFAFQGTRGLWSPDEGRYVGVTLQMMDSGNYLVPAYSPAELNFSKPPMTYWVIASSLQLFGRNTWAARLPYALMYLATLAILFAMGRKVTPRKPWLAPLVYATSLFTFFTANIVSTDVLLTFVESMAVLGFMMHVWPGANSRTPWARLLMWFGFGLAFLTKGPPGLLPLLPIVAFTAICDGWYAVGRLFHPLGILVFLFVGFTWYAIVMARYPWLPHYFLHEEVYGRIFTNMHKRHAGPMGWVIAFIPVLIFGTLPWSLGLAKTAREAMVFSRWNTWRKQRSVQLFLLLWFIVPFVIFCLAKSRLPLYLLPLFLPLALLAATHIEPWFDLANTHHRWLLLAWIALLVVVKGLASYIEVARVDNRVASREIAAIAKTDDYHALVFIEMTTDGYATEEQTPWGIRFYLNRPVYGIRWQEAGARAQICDAIAAQGRSLLLIDHDIPRADIDHALSRCKASGDSIGAWRQDDVFITRN